MYLLRYAEQLLIVTEGAMQPSVASGNRAGSEVDCAMALDHTNAIRRKIMVFQAQKNEKAALKFLGNRPEL